MFYTNATNEQKYSKSFFLNRQFSKTRIVEVARRRCPSVFWTSTTTLPNLCWPLTTSTSQSILVRERWLIPSLPRIRIKTKYVNFVIRYCFLYSQKDNWEDVVVFLLCFLFFSCSVYIIENGLFRVSVTLCSHLFPVSLSWPFLLFSFLRKSFW